MNLSGIISVAGMSGLYKVVGQSKNGLIVESITDKKRIPTYATHRISALEEISIYTTGEDKPLKDIFKAMFDKQKGGAAIEHKSSDDELKKYFESVLPDYDKDRVYVSDVRKVIMWYNILQANDLLKETGEADASSAEKTATIKAAEEKAKNFSKPASPAKLNVPKPSSGARKTTGVRKTGAA